MLCPHCGVGFSSNPPSRLLGGDSDGSWFVIVHKCTECRKFTIELQRADSSMPGRLGSCVEKHVVYPRASGRPPCPEDVPKGIAQDYNEACLVLADSTRASAALSRRCLQAVLRDAARVKPGDLNDEIQEVLDKKVLPTHLAKSIDAVRTVGNFAAHAIKRKSTGQIIDVEPAEAEWNLDTLEGLFDFYYVQPKKTETRRGELNKKLGDAGKPPLKDSGEPKSNKP